MENLETYLHEKLLQYDDHYQYLCESEQDETIEDFKKTLAGHHLAVQFHTLQVLKTTFGVVMTMIFRRRG